MSNKNAKRKDKEVQPNERLIVHNLSFETTEATLRDYFSQFGKVIEVDILLDSKSGRSRGFGFISFETIKGAIEANKEEHVHEIDERQIRTNFAKKRNEPKVQKGKKLYIGNLPWKLNEEELKSHFESFGEVDDAFLSTVKYAPLKDGYPQHKGFGFVTFVKEEDANKAVEEKEHIIKGKRLSVRKAKPQKGQNRREKRRPKARDEKKKQIVVKRKQGGSTKNKNNSNNKNNNNNGNNKKENKKEKQSTSGNKNNNNKSKANKVSKNEQKQKEPAKKKVQNKQKAKPKKGPRIVTNTKNPWKQINNAQSSNVEGFPNLNKKKEKKDTKGKGELDN